MLVSLHMLVVKHFLDTRVPMTLQLLTVVLLSFVPTSSASAASDMNVSYILSDSIPWLARFLTGAWQCSGGSPSGRVINADVEFTMVLGDRFMQSAHHDQPRPSVAESSAGAR